MSDSVHNQFPSPLSYQALCQALNIKTGQRRTHFLSESGDDWLVLPKRLTDRQVSQLVKSLDWDRNRTEVLKCWCGNYDCLNGRLVFTKAIWRRRGSRILVIRSWIHEPSDST